MILINWNPSLVASMTCVAQNMEENMDLSREKSVPSSGYLLLQDCNQNA